MQVLKKISLAVLISLLMLQFSYSVNDTTIVVTLCYPDESSQMNNVILANLSQSLPKENDKPCLKYNVTLKSQISQTSVTTFYNNAKVANTVVFQEFSLRDLMLPVTAFIEIEFYSGQSLIEKKELQFEMKQNGLCYTYNIPVGKVVTDIKYKIPKIELGQAMLDRIVARQQIISDYYTADIQIKLAEEELKKIDLDNIENNEQYQKVSQKSLATVERIKEKRFDETLFLNEHDPLRLIPRLNELQNLAQGKKSQLTQQTDNIGQEYYRLGVAALQKNDTVNAINNFNKAVEVEPRLSMPYVKLASIELSRRNQNKVIEIIRFVDKNTDLEPPTREESSLLINNIITELVEDARLTRQQGNLSDAILLIDSCYSICSSISHVSCTNTLDNERNTIYTKILENFIMKNENVLKDKKYDGFLTLTDSLYRFYILYKDHFNNQGLVYEHLNKSYQALLKTGEENIDGNPSVTLDALMASKQLCETYSEVSCNPQSNVLLNNVFGNLYNIMIDDAISLFEAQNYTASDSLQQKAYDYCQQQNLSISEKHTNLIKQLKERHYHSIIERLEAYAYKGCNALTMADSAVNIRKTYKFNAANNEAKVYKEAVNLCINQSIVDAEKGLISKHFEDVTTYLKKAEQLAENYNIELEQATTARIAEIRGLLEQSICNEIKFKIDIQINAADIHLKNLEYIYAIVALKKAKNIVESNTKCGFTTDEIDNKIKYCNLPAKFQSDCEKLVELINGHKFEAATAKLIDIEQTYPDSLLQPYALKAVNTIKFVKEYDYTPFTLGAVEYLADHGKTENALNLLYFIYEKDVPADLTDKAQDKMGRSLAKRDVVNQKESNPKEVCYQYVRHDKKWFKKMINSYKAQWKKSMVS
ncbi:MAG TPA: hypothetical protein PLS84_01050 [Salinivirgaceae bacterium]|nr:hypothetical protein [Salinivirgaceae bacterium]